MRIAISPRFATRTFENGATTTVFSLAMSIADQLTVARIAAAPVIVVLYVLDFEHHDYWATGLFAAAMATNWFDAWWTLLVALVITWVSGLDCARLTPGLLRSRAPA